MKIGSTAAAICRRWRWRSAGCEVSDCQGEILAVRAVKTPEEVKCLQVTMAGAEAAVAAVREAIKPGVIGERSLRHHVSRGDPPGRRVHRDAAADLRPAHQSLVQRGERPQDQAGRAGGARYRHDRLLWLLFRFLAHLPLRAGQADRLPEDRSTACPTTRCSTTSSIVKPGMAFREIAEKAWKIPERFVDQRYTSVMHGVGMHGETPFIAHAMDFATYGRDGIWCRHGGERRELYRREGRPRGRQARGGGAGHRHRHRAPVALSLRGRVSRSGRSG